MTYLSLFNRKVRKGLRDVRKALRTLLSNIGYKTLARFAVKRYSM